MGQSKMRVLKSVLWCVRIKSKGGVDVVEKLFQLCRDENFNVEEAEKVIKTVELNKVYDITRETEHHSPVKHKTTLLYEAYWYWNIKMVRLLLENGADPNFYEEWDGPIIDDLRFNWFEKEEKECFELLKLLFDYGADPNLVWENESVVESALGSLNDDFSTPEEHRYNEKYYTYLIVKGGRPRYFTQEWYEEVLEAMTEEYKKFFTEDGFLK